jgi:hypothetical protein
MAVPFPYRKSCKTGKPVLNPPAAAGRLLIIAIIAPLEAITMYKTELVISHLRAVEMVSDIFLFLAPGEA